KMRKCKHTDYSRFERVVSEENRTRLSDSQFRAGKTCRSIGNVGRTSSLAYSYTFPAQQREYCSPLLMLTKVWRNNNFTGNQCGVGGNDLCSLCQASYLVRLTPSRGESPLKAGEKICRGWMTQSYSSFYVTRASLGPLASNGNGICYHPAGRVVHQTDFHLQR